MLQEFTKDALRVIEIGLKIREIVCCANLLKLRGLIHMESRDYKLALKDYKEALKKFKISNSPHGTAICKAALGYLYLHKISNGEDQKKAKWYIEESLRLYEEEEHYAGQAYCYYNLCLLSKGDRAKVEHS